MNNFKFILKAVIILPILVMLMLPSTHGQSKTELSDEDIQELLEIYEDFVKFDLIEGCYQDAIDHLYGFAAKIEQSSIGQYEVSLEEERKYGAEAHENIMKDKKKVFFHPKKVTYEKIKYALRKARDPKNQPVKFHLFESPQIDAFSIFGGHIYVSDGLLDFAETEDELAFVIAHELSHIDKNHCLSKIQKILFANQMGGEKYGFILGRMYLVASAPFGQATEYEADLAAIQLLKNAGYDPRAGISFFERLSKKVPEKSMVEKINSTHPFHEDRIKCMKNNM